MKRDADRELTGCEYLADFIQTIDVLGLVTYNNFTFEKYGHLLPANVPTCKKIVCLCESTTRPIHEWEMHWWDSPKEDPSLRSEKSSRK